MAESEPIHNHVEKNAPKMNKADTNTAEMNNTDNGNDRGMDGIDSNPPESNTIESNIEEGDKLEVDGEELIYCKFLSGIDTNVLQATSLFGIDTFKEICRTLNTNDADASGFIKSELAKVRLKLIFMQRLNTFGFAPDCRKGLLDAIKNYDSLQLMGLYRRINTCAEIINIMQAVASELDIEPPILKRAKTVLLTHLGFFLTLLPPNAAATAISIAMLTFHAKCVYSITRIAKASHTAESTIYENIKKLLKFKGFPGTDFRKFYVIESLVFSFKGFFLVNKKVVPDLIDQYKTAQNRFCTRILLCAQSGYINSIRFRRKFLPLKEFFETNLMHLIDAGFISFKHTERTNRTTYKLTEQGRAELDRSLELYREADEVSKLGERSAAEDWEVWEGFDDQESFTITLPLDFLMNPKEDVET